MQDARFARTVNSCLMGPFAIKVYVLPRCLSYFRTGTSECCELLRDIFPIEKLVPTLPRLETCGYESKQAETPVFATITSKIGRRIVTVTVTGTIKCDKASHPPVVSLREASNQPRSTF